MWSDLNRTERVVFVGFIVVFLPLALVWAGLWIIWYFIKEWWQA